MGKRDDRIMRFAMEYMKDHHQLNAAIRAGFKGKTESIRVRACQLMRRPEVQEYIRKEKARIAAEAAVTAEDVLAELKKIAFVNIQDLVHEDNTPRNVANLPRELVAAVAEVSHEVKATKFETTTTKKIKLYDKISALEKLGKYLGLFEKDNLQKRAVVRVGFDESEDDE